VGVFSIEVSNNDDVVMAANECLEHGGVELQLVVWRAVVRDYYDAPCSHVKFDSHDIINIGGDVCENCVDGDVDSHPTTGTSSTMTVPQAGHPVPGNPWRWFVVEPCLVQNNDVRSVVVEVFVKFEPLPPKTVDFEVYYG